MSPSGRGKALMLKMSSSSQSIAELLSLGYILFIDEQRCYEYESTFARKNAKVVALSASQKEYLQKLYNIL